VNCPRSRGAYFAIRVAVQELGSFLDAGIPEVGHDPTLLGAEHVDQFAPQVNVELLGSMGRRTLARHDPGREGPTATYSLESA
jgi:hypothetical protein